MPMDPDCRFGQCERSAPIQEELLAEFAAAYDPTTWFDPLAGFDPVLPDLEIPTFDAPFPDPEQDPAPFPRVVDVPGSSFDDIEPSADRAEPLVASPYEPEPRPQVPPVPLFDTPWVVAGGDDGRLYPVMPWMPDHFVNAPDPEPESAFPVSPYEGVPVNQSFGIRGE